MKEEYIREFATQKIIGILETYDNGDQAVRDFPTRMILGYYRAKQNQTTDFIGRILTQGNTVVSLLYKNK